MPIADDSSASRKRRASEVADTFSDWRRFEKRLRALSIRNEERLAEKNSAPQWHGQQNSKPAVLVSGFKRTPTPTPPALDGMQIDDTRNRVYIADIDAELAESSSDEERLIFIPDIEKRLNRLPPQFYQSAATQNQGPRELVLYSDPKSLSVDEGHDSVRKAVVEARHRAREKAAAETRARQEDMERSYGAINTGRWASVNGDASVETAHGYGDAGYVSPLRLDQDAEADSDAMDLG